MSKDGCKSPLTTAENQQHQHNAGDVLYPDVESDLLKHDFTKLRKLCVTTKNNICSNISQPYDEISGQMVAKNGKISKTYLFNQLKKFVDLCDDMCSRDSNTTSYVASNLLSGEPTPTNSNIMSDYANIINSNHNELVELISNKFENNFISKPSISNIEQQLLSLQASVDSLKLDQNAVNTLPTYHSIKPEIDTAKTNGHNTNNPTDHVEQHLSKYVSDEQADEILNFLSEQTDYTELKRRSVLSFGEPYPYTGSPKGSYEPTLYLMLYQN